MVNNKKLKHCTCFFTKRQSGQAMTEYVIVLVTLVGLAATTPLIDELSNLKEAIQSKNRGYAYGISLSDYLNSENANDYVVGAWPILTDIDGIISIDPKIYFKSPSLSIESNFKIDFSEIFKEFF